MTMCCLLTAQRKKLNNALLTAHVAGCTSLAKPMVWRYLAKLGGKPWPVKGFAAFSRTTCSWRRLFATSVNLFANAARRKIRIYQWKRLLFYPIAGLRRRYRARVRKWRGVSQEILALDNA